MESYLIHLIRHGVAEGNVLSQYIGSVDSPPCEQGTEQLLQIKQKQEYPLAQMCHSSPLTHRMQTAQILYPDTKPALLDDLRECDFDDWGGKTARGLESDPAFLRWTESGQQAAPPNGEDSRVLLHRVCSAFEQLVGELLRSGTTSVVAVTHGGVMMVLLTSYGLPRALVYEQMTGPGCGYTLRATPGLQMRSVVAEVVATIPHDNQGTLREHTVVDLACEVANRVYGKESSSKKQGLIK